MINTNVPDTEIAVTSLTTTLTNDDNNLSSVEPGLIQDTNVEEDLLPYARSPVSVYTGRNLIGSTPIMTMVPNLDLHKSRIPTNLAFPRLIRFISLLFTFLLQH